jgi:hypothetical protein
MTVQKQLKARIRARMAKTGERYTTARRHVLGAATDTVRDNGYALGGGLHPDSACLVKVFAHHGYTRLSEAMVLGIGGGLGAGYILWEFAAHDMKCLTLGYRYRWNYLDWQLRTLDRLGATYELHTTGGTRGAAAALDAALATGHPAIVVPDRGVVGYWGLPEHLNGYGGHPVVAYAAVADGIRVDDRNHAPLTVPREVLNQARGRVSSYKNHLVTLTTTPAVTDLRPAILAGLRDCVAHLGAKSTSFAVPAWHKWARMVTDTRNPKGWPRLFADGTGLVGTLLSVWEGVQQVGMSGGHLRAMYGDFLDEAAGLLDAPVLHDSAEDFRLAGAAWNAVAEAALPADVAQFATLRDLTAEVAEGVAAGDAGASARAEATQKLWRLSREYDQKPPDVDRAQMFAELSERLAAVHDLERTAVERLEKTVGTLS